MATRGDSRLLVDTSVLLEASNTARRHHSTALDLLETHPALVLPAQVAREFLVVATRTPDANGLGLRLDEALDNLAEIRSNVSLLPEERPLLPELLRLLKRIPSVGKQIHDAHVVAAALVHRVGAIVTMNRADFHRYEEVIRVVDPAGAMR